MSSFLNADLPSEDEEDEDFVGDELGEGAKAKAKVKPKKRCARVAASPGLRPPAARRRDRHFDVLHAQGTHLDAPTGPAGAALPRRRRPSRMRGPAARGATTGRRQTSQRRRG
jgi:hypothetical protein